MISVNYILEGSKCGIDGEVRELFIEHKLHPIPVSHFLVLVAEEERLVSQK